MIEEKQNYERYSIEFVDDGTMDAVVYFRGETYRFDNELRQEMGDREFLVWAMNDILDQLAY